MMGRQTGDQSQLFYLFNLERRIPTSHLLRRINPIVTRVLADLREKLAPFYIDSKNRSSRFDCCSLGARGRLFQQHRPKADHQTDRSQPIEDQRLKKARNYFNLSS